MRTPVRTSIFIAAVVVFGTLAGWHLVRPQERDPDPFQFPDLANSNPFQRWYLDFQPRAYPLGYIPQDARLRAIQEIEQLAGSSTIRPLNVLPNFWENIGAAPVVQGSQKYSGRVSDITVHPGDPNHWLIGTAQGGVWETLNAGLTWTAKTDSQYSQSIGSIVYHQSNPSIIYAGTGEAVFSADAYAGVGLLKSTDGGATWGLVGVASFSKRAFSDVKVDPSNPDVLVAATSRAIAGEGPTFPTTAPTGTLRSVNGGLAWSLILSGRATDLEVVPSNFIYQYAGIGNIYGSAAGDTLNGVYRSTDAGQSWAFVVGPWTSAPEGVGRVEIAVSPSNPNTLYVSIQDAFNSVGVDGGLLGVWRTDNAWAATPSWTALPSTADGYKQWWYDHEIIVDPNNPNVVYLGGVLLRRFDGSIWTDVTGTIHVDQHTMAWAGNRLIVGNDGGVYSTIDGGTTWNNHNTNLSIAQYYSGSTHPANFNLALGGSQDNGTHKWTGSMTWTRIFGADGGDNEISTSNPDIHWQISTQHLGILRTMDGGSSFFSASSGIDGISAPFIGRVKKCPANDNVFIAGTDNLWKSNNFFLPGSPSWFPDSPELASRVSTVAFAASDSTCGTYALGTENGQLWLTSNNGAAWSNIDPANAVPNRWVTGLVFEPSNPNILYVTLSGFDEGTPGQPGHIFKTVNALAGSPTWTNVSPPVNIPCNAIVLNPLNPDNVWVGTDLGVLRSYNAGAAWSLIALGYGMPYVAVFDLQINHATNLPVAFTHGRGAFVLSTEKCANGIDDDFDLLIDCVDPDCFFGGPILSMPVNAIGYPETSVSLPLNLVNLSGAGVLSADVSVQFNPAVMVASAVTLGTVASGCSLTANLSTPGTVALTVFCTTPMTGGGSLAEIAFNASGAFGQSSPLDVSGTLNEGTPAVCIGDGFFTISTTASISGEVVYYRDSATGAEPSTKVVSDAVLNLTGTGLGVPDVAITNAAGAYSFSGKPLGQNYTVTPKKLGGCQPVTPPPLVVSNLDAALNAQDVVGLTTLTTKQLLAADVSGNGTNSGYDSALIAQCAAGLIGSFPVATTLVSDWFMVATPASVPNQSVVSPVPAAGVQGGINYTPLVTPASGQNFLGGLFGDVSGNWPSQGTEAILPDPGTSANVESTTTVDLASRLVVPKLVAAPGETARVGIRAEGVEKAVAFDLELRFDPAVLRLVVTEVGQAASGFTLTSNPGEAGRVRLGLFHATPLGSDGEIAVVTFQVIGKAPRRSALQLSGDVDEGRIPVSIRQGSVRVSSKIGVR